MNELISHAVTCFLGFFAIMNPIANTAAFVGLTADYTPNERQKVAFKSLLTTFLIILVFSVLGNLIFQLFGITIHALRITGGILLFIIGYQMLHGEGSKMHSSTASHNMGIAISPLAVPLLAGPGTIATAMNYAVSGDSVKIVVTLGAFLFYKYNYLFLLYFWSAIGIIYWSSWIKYYYPINGINYCCYWC